MMISSSNELKNKIENNYQKEHYLSQSNNPMIFHSKRESNLTTASLNQTHLRYSKSRSSLSCLKYQKSDKETFNNKRKDIFGNEILKGSKEHKISFIDQISSQKIAEVVLIDSNFQNNKYNNSNNKELCQCISCHLF
jgi:hypothetical protein